MMIFCLTQVSSGNYKVLKTRQCWPFIIWLPELRRIWSARFSIPEVLGKFFSISNWLSKFCDGFHTCMWHTDKRLKSVVRLDKLHLSTECNFTDLWLSRQVFQDFLPCLDIFCQRFSFGVLTVILDRLLIIGDLFTLHDHHMIISFSNIHPKFDQGWVIISL